MNKSNLYIVQTIQDNVFVSNWPLLWLHHTHLNSFIEMQIPTPHLKHTELDCLGWGRGAMEHAFCKLPK